MYVTLMTPEDVLNMEYLRRSFRGLILKTSPSQPPKIYITYTIGVKSREC